MYASAPTPLYVGGYEELVTARRQKKTTHKYYPYQLATTGWWWKWNAISQAAYHRLASVLTKANRAVQSIVELGCNSCKVNLC
jgi:myo-inositol catabolism protein IolC